ncbi:MAG: PilZ domain-containing protein [Candidatus Aminicenantales bacterium]
MSEWNESKPERRRFPRIKVPVYYRPASIFKARSMVYNIGLGGIRVYSDEYLKEGKRFEIELFLPDGLSVEAITRVIWIKELPPQAEARYDVGLEFIELSPGAAEALKQLLEESSTE